MERLTDKKEADTQRQEYEKRLKNGYPRNIPEERFLKLAAYEDTGLEPEEIREAYSKGFQSALDVIAYAEQEGTVLVDIPLLEEYIKLGTLEHLRELSQAEKDGRLVVLPCNIRQPLYILKNGEIHRNYGCQWHFTDKESQTFGTLSLYGEFVNLDDFGKTVFLTREEAEAALK